MTENFPGAAGPVPQRPEQPVDQAAHQGAVTPEAQHGAVGEPSPWSPAYGLPAREQGLPGREPPTGQWQQGAQPVGGFHGVPTGPGAGPQDPSLTQRGMSPAVQGRGRMRVVIGVAVLAALVGGAAGSVGTYLVEQQGSSVVNSLNAPPPARSAGNVPAGSVSDVANKVLPTVVEIKTREGEGSGIIVSNDGMIVTNNHVVASAAGGGQIEVDFSDGKQAAASIIGRDPTSDIAVIKARDVSGLATAELGRSDDLVIGQQVVAIGSPFDLAGTVTTGIVSSLHRPVNVGPEQTGPQLPRGRGGLGQSQDQGQGTQATVLDAIQTDASINPGNSGGPLVNMQGQVIGINSAISSPNASPQSQGGSVGIGFAIPIDQAKRTAQQIQQSGKATQTLLGVSVQTNNDPAGATVQSVNAGSPAEQAGLKAGDVITKLDDRAITSSDALVAAVHAKAPGDKVTLTLSGGRTVQATLTGTTVDVPN